MANAKSNGHTNGHGKKPIKRRHLSNEPIRGAGPSEHKGTHHHAEKGTDYLAEARKQAANKRQEIQRERELMKHAGYLYDYHSERYMRTSAEGGGQHKKYVKKSDLKPLPKEQRNKSELN